MRGENGYSMSASMPLSLLVTIPYSCGCLVVSSARDSVRWQVSARRQPNFVMDSPRHDPNAGMSGPLVWCDLDINADEVLMNTLGRRGFDHQSIECKVLAAAVIIL